MDETQNSSMRRNDSSLYTGLGFIIVGVIFLLRNLDIITFGRNWWALFFLIPISYLLRDVLRYRRDDNRKFPSKARGSLIGLISVSTVMLIFLFGMNWGMIWPVFIVIGGLSLILASMGRKHRS
jgi:hypothetical protein